MLIMGDQAPLVRKYEAEVPAIGAAATGSAPIRCEFAGTVTSVTHVPVAAITGAATNNRTISVVNRGQDGTGTTVVASLNFANGVNAAAFDEKDITLSVVANATTVAEGDILELRSAAVGSGIADPGGTAFITVSRN
jgi:hypothetical protein